MNILFLTLSRISDVSARGIYTDLIREFISHGHQMYVVVPMERRFHQSTQVIESAGAKILQVETLNIQKTNVIEKGIGTLLLEYQYQRAISHYWKNIKFDLVLYSTPPITFNKVIASVKKRYGAKSYLLLKDIFPQNAVDLGMFSKRSLFYKLFRSKEKRLYELSDYIGCMSPANVDYVLKHNPAVSKEKVEVCPNTITVLDDNKNHKSYVEIRAKYNLPIDKPIFIYGGNLGKPQGIDFLLKCLEANKNRTDAYFLIVGSGTEYNKISLWFSENSPENMTLYKALPHEDYDQLVQSCDVGLIFLDHRFTIPNFPSRLLSYLEYKMPIIAATDKSTDMGKIAEKNGFGYSLESVFVDDFSKCVNSYINDNDKIKKMGEKGYIYLLNNYQTSKAYYTIISHM